MPEARHNTCQVIVGRLMEIAVDAGYHAVSDIDDMIGQMEGHFARVPEPTRFVIAADWRACKLFTPAVAARAVHMLLRSHARVERRAILHAANQPTSVLQVLRIVGESQLTNSRVFTDPAELQRWLGEVVDSAEHERVQAFYQRSLPGGITSVRARP
ncbi:MAG: hypothetical protein ABW321_01480 [Polyangiales bacterium]